MSGRSAGWADRAARNLSLDKFVLAASLTEVLRGRPTRPRPAPVPPPPGLVGTLECGRHDRAARVLLPLLPKGALGRLDHRPSSAGVTQWFRAELPFALAYIPERCRRKLAAALSRAARHKARCHVQVVFADQQWG
jgi:hypothetical protein